MRKAQLVINSTIMGAFDYSGMIDSYLRDRHLVLCKENRDELVAQLESGETASEVFRRARDWAAEEAFEARAEAADYARFDADH